MLLLCLNLAYFGDVQDNGFKKLVLEVHTFELMIITSHAGLQLRNGI
jgi:hypothetical protein